MYPRATELGINIAAIGNGTSSMAVRFAEEFSIPFPLYTDPSRKSYKALRLKRSFGLSLKSVQHVKRVVGKGFKQGMVQGDVWQQGGEAIFRTDGTIAWKQRSELAGDQSNIKELLKQINLFSLEMG
ncbi:MAG: peroxiredoxin-like family protein [Myxococcota bacterium]|nr:peroxiredoxin-like family protein [Myxococcota bacterium]